MSVEIKTFHKQMEYLCEIHVSIDVKDLIEFKLWCLDNDVKPLYIVGEVPELTFSKYTNGTYEKCYNKALDIARNISLNNIRVLRVRVEAIFSNENINIDEHAKTNENGYFEFHIKYHIINSKDYYELVRLSQEFTKTHKQYTFVGFNIVKKGVEPIITLRVHSNCLTKNALNYKDELMNMLKLHGYKTNEQIHKEYVYVDELYSKL